MQNVMPASSAQFYEQKRLRQRIGTWVVLLMIIVLVGASFSWLQWASQRGLKLGYPVPTVHMTVQGGILRLQQQSNFSAAATGRELSYRWDFGDQGSATGQQVSHVYTNNGPYTVTVTVIDSMGQTSSDSSTVQVLPPPPVANFTYSVGYYGEVYFDASNSTVDASTSIQSYNWDFGDGNTNTTTYAQEYYTYNSTGNYTVQLTVTDATGQQSDVYSATVVIS